MGKRTRKTDRLRPTKQVDGNMLIGRSKEMIDNPNCYVVKRGEGYVPTANATKKERLAIEKFNERIARGEERMCHIVMDDQTRSLIIKQAKERGMSETEIEALFSE